MPPRPLAPRGPRKCTPKVCPQESDGNETHGGIGYQYGEAVEGAMGGLTEIFLREQLAGRRQKLESALAAGRETATLSRLLREVDAALERMEAGTYGLCEACHEPIEKERLLADPLVCYCLDHLTPDQQRALERDLELASLIQRELLPRRELSYDGWQIAYHYQPLGPVSGDYCDVVIPEDPSQGLFFALGDASGKGVAASMLMAQLHAIFRTLLASGLPLRELVSRASRLFCESTSPGSYATLVCGRAGRSAKLEICNAGHTPAVWVRNGQATKLEATGVPLGMFSSVDYPTQTIQLSRGDTLFLYTDGLTETHSAGGEEYGEERLMKVLERSASLTPQAILQACIQDAQQFGAGAPASDDLAMMAIRRVE